MAQDINSLLPKALAAFLAACRLDVETVKPGNVSIGSAGHGMTAAQFIASADAAAHGLFEPGARVGKRILEAVRRTREVAGCNTNLGIVLLVAPMAAALEDFPDATLTLDTWRNATERTLARLNIDDARDAYRAIALANPGGLGEAPEQSAHDAPTIDLRSAMTLAAQRDSIARQYANGFADVFDSARNVQAIDETSTLALFLRFLSGWPDSHIVRKHGLPVAQSVTDEARRWRDALHREGYEGVQQDLLSWDAELKALGINPGTSADLTVATLFAAGLARADAY
ncbi:triphosphoribosyl-dephospho-CoA synthase [Burkholderia sp. Leaf177]|uniref:triphosphoribosyl-dephospho-CoA synthase n=1 Tax=Burkholderia sp. Leaf177 TaxID=1736287 RepID=UPI0006FDC2AF|nr:triphosphoribosyl-dephospho-CoA synthase [Burkholderia sp. Leaf177]KQR76505.1 triphosphoribosyl-dephospho-CoA synthase [Burkholderia sp. Leaf177]